MFNKRLQKALKQDFKSTEEVVKWCRKEVSKNYSERKVTHYQNIADYLIYKLENNLDITFEEYQKILYEKIWGV